jgi:lipopolysaccharide biosynthesis regulator YciM
MPRLSRWLGGGSRGKVASSDRALAEKFRTALLAVLEGDYDRAEELITDAVRADSEDVEPYRSLARLYRIRGELGRAIRIHQNLLLRRDLDAQQRNGVLAELAADFRQGGFIQRAIASYQEVLAHEPRNAIALRALAGLLADAQDFAQALAMARRLAKVEKQPDPTAEARLLTRMAESLQGAGNGDQARRSVKRALRRDPEYADARMLLGALEFERGRHKAALAAWRSVPEKGGARAGEAYPRLETCFAALGRPADYERFVRELLEQRPDDAAARMAFAASLSARGELESGVLELRRVLDRDPENVQARIALGRMLISDNRDAAAIKEYRELLEWLDRRALRFSQLREVDGVSDGNVPE